MTLQGTRTYVGFGFGAIQAGLFLYEAFRSGDFCRLVVAEVLPEVVSAVRQASGHFSLNIAHPNRVEQADIGPIHVENPSLKRDRERLIEAIAEAEEIGTAVPNVAYYLSENPGSLHCILAKGLRLKAAYGGPPAVVYTAENHNHAAEILREAVLAQIPNLERAAVCRRACFVNTVIGKMSGIVSNPDEISARNLAPITPGLTRAFVVEAFNHILISDIRFEHGFERGIKVFEEKPDLLPFEEAKLYGHNATHALAAYLGAVLGVSYMADLRARPEMMNFLRTAFIEESGQALMRKYGGLDSLFTAAGYQQYADDLLERMTNPYLGDTVERVARDPQRKLGWNDRLLGTIRLALQQGVTPRHYAQGVVAALLTMPTQDSATNHAVLDLTIPLSTWLKPLWALASPDQSEQKIVLNLIEDSRQEFKHWLDCNSQDILAV
ncbi:MAG: hypothetical protein JXM69_02680 [Anaerolineae bacterium]|nr:hypothetical protein [Anaerolineae bacterium]